jgi:hypothetical protein
MASSTTKVDQTAFSQENDMTAILHEEAVDLWFNILYALGILLQPSYVNLNVEMANVYSN